jgi:Mg2+/Co2+ transporter CorC
MLKFVEFPVANRFTNGYHGCLPENWSMVREQLNKNRSFASHALVVYIHDEIEKVNDKYKLLRPDKQMERVPQPTEKLLMGLPDDIFKLFSDELEETIIAHTKSMRLERRKRLEELTNFIWQLDVEWVPKSFSDPVNVTQFYSSIKWNRISLLMTMLKI